MPLCIFVAFFCKERPARFILFNMKTALLFFFGMFCGVVVLIGFLLEVDQTIDSLPLTFFPHFSIDEQYALMVNTVQIILQIIKHAQHQQINNYPPIKKVLFYFVICLAFIACFILIAKDNAQFDQIVRGIITIQPHNVE